MYPRPEGNQNKSEIVEHGLDTALLGEVDEEGDTKLDTRRVGGEIWLKQKL